MLFLAALPLIVAICCMVLRRPAHHAALIALATALITAAVWFPISAAAAGQTAAAITPTLAEVLAIMFGGVLLAGVLDATGAQARIAAWIEHACAGDRFSAAVLITLGVTPFAESLTGFGMGAIVAVPLLLHLGFDRVRALVLAMTGLILTVWGALANGTLVAAQLAQVDAATLGLRSAELAPTGIITSALVIVVCAGVRPTAAGIGEVTLTAAVHAATLWATSAYLSNALAGPLGALAAISACLLRAGVVRHVDLRLDRATRRAMIPYAVLIGGLLAATVLSRLVTLHGVAGLLTHGSLWSLCAGVVAMRLGAMTRPQVRAALAASVRKWVPVATATGGFLIMGAVLTATGMSARIGAVLASAGSAYPALSALIAAASGYVAGSNTGANAMFASAQTHAGMTLGVDPAAAAAVHNFGSGAATIAAPSRVALAATLIDGDRERAMVRATGPLLAAVALVTVMLTVIGYAR